MGKFSSRLPIRRGLVAGWFAVGALGRGSTGYTSGAGSPAPAPAPAGDSRVTAAGDDRVTANGDSRVTA